MPTREFELMSSFVNVEIRPSWTGIDPDKLLPFTLIDVTRPDAQVTVVESQFDTDPVHTLPEVGVVPLQVQLGILLLAPKAADNIHIKLS